MSNTIQGQNRPATAATDVPDLLAEIDGGQFELMLSRALSDVAAAVVDHGHAHGEVRKGKVNIEFTFEHIKGTAQVRVDHGIKFARPTSMGKASEETKGTVVLHVGRYGALTITQQRLEFDPSKQPGLSGLDKSS